MTPLANAKAEANRQCECPPMANEVHWSKEIERESSFWANGTSKEVCRQPSLTCAVPDCTEPARSAAQSHNIPRRLSGIPYALHIREGRTPAFPASPPLIMPQDTATTKEKHALSDPPVERGREDRRQCSFQCVLCWSIETGNIGAPR